MHTYKLWKATQVTVSYNNNSFTEIFSKNLLGSIFSFRMIISATGEKLLSDSFSDLLLKIVKEQRLFFMN